MTRYPNLLAEYEVGNCGHIHTLCRWANTTQDLMEAVLYNGAELSEDEFDNMSKVLDKKYISAPELEYIEKNDRILQYRLKELVEWFDVIETKTAAFGQCSFERGQFENVQTLVKYYREGRDITVAIYRAGFSGKRMVEYALTPKKLPRSLNEPVANQTTVAPRKPLLLEDERKKKKTEQPKQIVGIDSRLVAEMIGKSHAHLLRDINSYIEYLGESKIGFTDFFLESSYLSSQNKEMPCYILTRKGCDMVRNKMTGEKGVRFTAAYINKFHEMEQELQEPSPTTAPAPSGDLIKTLLDKIQNLENQIAEINNKVGQVSLLALPETSVAFDTLFKTPTIRYTTTAIGKAFGISARAVNRYLLAQNVHRPEGKGWVLNKKYANCNFVYQKAGFFANENGEKEERLMTWWTPEGMEFVRMLLVNSGLKQKTQIEPYDRHGNRGKRSKKKIA